MNKQGEKERLMKRFQREVNKYINGLNQWKKRKKYKSLE